MTRINTNVSSLIATKYLARTQTDLADTFRQLSTGLRINSGQDDPAGLIADETLRQELAAINAELDANFRADRILSTADSGLGQIGGLLSQLRGLVVESANTGVLSASEREANQQLINGTIESINRIANSTQLGGHKLLDGSYRLQFSSGGGLELPSFNAAYLGAEAIGEAALASLISGGANSPSAGNAQSADAILTRAIGQVASARGRIGAFQKNTIGSNVRTLSSLVENITAARSQIRDTDYAVATAALARGQILNSAGLGVLVLANRNPTSVLALTEQLNSRA